MTIWKRLHAYQPSQFALGCDGDPFPPCSVCGSCYHNSRHRELSLDEKRATQNGPPPCPKMGPTEELLAEHWGRPHPDYRPGECV